MADQSTETTVKAGKRRGDELVFVALGGLGEVGMNCYLYGLGAEGARRWLMVDLGITFPEGEFDPGVDVILPDLKYIEAHAHALDGLVITHAHEDHIGAVIELWPRLRCPVYATPFTAAFLKAKLAEHGNGLKIPVTEVPLGGRFEVGPFRLEYISMSHSIPEPSALAIGTPHGTVLHTGDWKLDQFPVVGQPADEARLERLGQEGVLALVGDSTNAFRDGRSPSELEVARSLAGIVKGAKRRVLITSFASNVARIRAVADAARASGRRLVVAGRALHRAIQVAIDTGYLPQGFQWSDQQEFSYLAPEEVLAMVTGSQGEPRAALTRIARNDHPHVSLEAGDTCIFSSRIIPGNERAISRLQDDLLRIGVEVLTERDHFVHVSGHPCRDELVRMYQWVRPQLAIPVHGEHRHMVAHADLARSCQVPQSILAENGTLVRLAPGTPSVVGQVPTGRLAVEGDAILPLDGPALRARQRIANHGALVATLVLDRDGRPVAPAKIAAPGIYDPEADAEAIGEVAAAAVAALDRLSARDRRDDPAVEEAVAAAVRRIVRIGRGKRPATTVHLVRV